jgi:hypothetical protein
MPTLWISEFEAMPLDSGLATPPISALPPVAEQTRSISGSSAQSSAFNTRTRFVRLHTDTACHVVVGANPTATTGALKLPADATEYFGVTAGHKIAVIQA